MVKQMEKNFLGLDGLSNFWSKAKTWIINRITAEVTEAISGKADKSHTHTKSEITDFPTSLPANGGTATKATQDGSGNVITSTYVKKSGDTLTSSTSDTPLYVNTTASGKTKSWIGFQIGSVSKNYIGADQNGLYSYTNSKDNKILDTSAQTLTDEEKTQVRSNIGAGTSSLTIGTTATTAAAGNHTHTKSDVGLDKVDNTADSDKSVKYASSAGSVSWANVSDKPAYITGSYSNGVLNLYTN